MTNVPSQGDPQLLSRWSGSRGGSVPERCRAYRWQYSAGEAYERIGVDCDQAFPRSRSASDSGPRVTTPTVELVGAAAAVYRHSDENGSATAGVRAPT
jgi:hypothetical protein